jgi:hypothetical protein
MLTAGESPIQDALLSALATACMMPLLLKVAPETGVYVGGLIAYYLGDDGLVSALEEVRRVAFGYESYRRYLSALYGDGDGRSAAAVAGAGALIGAVLIC